MDQHTPGPWKPQGAVVMDAANNPIGSFLLLHDSVVSQDQMRANAKLAAAAPELLKALRKIANLSEGDCAKYVRKVDDIACVALAVLEFDLSEGKVGK